MRFGATSLPPMGGATATLISRLNFAAGDQVEVTVNGVTNPSVSGAKTLGLSTTSDPAVATVSYNIRTSGSVTGVVRDQASVAQAGAPVQACPSLGGSCVVATSDQIGRYTIADLTPGQWTLTALPSADSTLQPGRAGPLGILAGVLTNQDLVLLPPVALPPGATITNRYLTSDGVPVLFWKEAIVLTVTGCPGARGTYFIRQGATVLRTGPLTEIATGLYRASVPALFPSHGPATVSTELQCPGGSIGSGTYTIYIDPSGTVEDSDGNAIPGATVTLLRADIAEGPFVAVASGSAVMSPSNRTNPMMTGIDGIFHWDVLAGFYKVRAVKEGCRTPSGGSAAESRVYEVPPPAEGIVLTLNCRSGLAVPPLPGPMGQQLTPVTPSRVFDSRQATLPLTGGVRLAAGTLTKVKVAGTSVVPDETGWVLANVTVIDGTGTGLLRWSAGKPQAERASRPITEGGSSGLELLPVDGDGNVTFEPTIETHLIIDVAGYLTPLPAPGRVRAGRILQTGAVALVQPTVLSAGGATEFDISSVPEWASFAVIRITAQANAGPGFVTVSPVGATRYGASQLHVPAGDVIATNLAIVPLRRLSLYTSDAATVSVELVGYVTNEAADESTAGLIVPADPKLLVDVVVDPGEAVHVDLPARPTGSTMSAWIGLSVADAARPGEVRLWAGRRPEAPTRRYQSGPLTHSPELVAIGDQTTLTITTSTSARVRAQLIAYLLS